MSVHKGVSGSGEVSGSGGCLIWEGAWSLGGVPGLWGGAWSLGGCLVLGECLSWGVSGQAGSGPRGWLGRPAWTATAVGITHPTGMHSCFYILLKLG